MLSAELWHTPTASRKQLHIPKLLKKGKFRLNTPVGTGTTQWRICWNSRRALTGVSLSGDSNLPTGVSVSLSPLALQQASHLHTSISRVCSECSHTEKPSSEQQDSGSLEVWLLQADMKATVQPRRAGERLWTLNLSHSWQTCCNCVKLSRQHEPKSLRNVFSSVLNRCHRIKAALKAELATASSQRSSAARTS